MRTITYLIMGFALLFSSCKKEEDKVTEIKLSQVEDLILQVGEVSKKISITGGDGKEYMVVSSNKEIAVVVQEGNTFTVEAKSQGEVIVKVTSGGKMAILRVTVPKPEVPIPEIELSQKEDLHLEVGKTSESIKISGGDGKQYAVSSSDEKIAKVVQKDNTFTVEGKSEGASDITVSSGGKSKKLHVIVSPKQNVLITKIDLGSQKKFQVGKNGKITPVISPSDATNQKLTWESSNTGVVQIAADSDGSFFVRNVPGQSATITAKATDGSGVVASIEIMAMKWIESIDVQPGGSILEQIPGGFIQFRLNIEPADATDKSVTWTSSDPEAISVTQEGRIDLRTEGVAIITVRANDGSDVVHKKEIRSYFFVNKILIDQANGTDKMTVKKGTNAPLSFSTWLTGTSQPDQLIDDKVTKAKGKSKYSEVKFSIPVYADRYKATVSLDANGDWILKPLQAGQMKLRVTYTNTLKTDDFIESEVTVTITD